MILLKSVHDKKDDFLMILEEDKKKFFEMLKFGLMPSSREQFRECRIRLFVNTSDDVFR